MEDVEISSQNVEYDSYVKAERSPVHDTLPPQHNVLNLHNSQKKKEKFKEIYSKLNLTLEKIRKEAIVIAQSGEVDVANFLPSTTEKNNTQEFQKENCEGNTNIQGGKKFKHVDKVLVGSYHSDIKRNSTPLTIPPCTGKSYKLYNCSEPLCEYVTSNHNKFCKHTEVHCRQKLKGKNGYSSVPQQESKCEELQAILERKYEELLGCINRNDVQYINSKCKSFADRIAKCSLCDFFGFSIEDLKKHHFQSHSNDTFQLSCYICSFRSKSLRYLRRHEKNHHKVTGNDDNNNDNEDTENNLTGFCKTLKCFECDFQTFHRIILTRHEREHANFKNKASILNSNRLKRRSSRSPAEHAVINAVKLEP